MLSLGVIARSRKENEQRLPIHPDHFDFIPQSVRGSIRFENGYGRKTCWRCAREASSGAGPTVCNRKRSPRSPSTGG